MQKQVAESESFSAAISALNLWTVMTVRVVLKLHFHILLSVNTSLVPMHSKY